MNSVHKKKRKKRSNERRSLGQNSGHKGFVKHGFSYRVYIFAPTLTTLFLFLFFRFNSVTDWLISQSPIFNFLRFSGDSIAVSNALSFCLVVWSGTFASIAALDYMKTRVLNDHSVNAFTYINSDYFRIFRQNTIHYATLSPKTYGKMDLMPTQRTVGPLRRRVNSEDVQNTNTEKLNTSHCPDFDLPEYNPDGPNPFSK